MKKNNKGFTLTELIIVIVIIGILAAVLIPSLTGYVRKARFSSDQQDAGNMTMLVSAYCAENNIKVNKLTPNEVKTIINMDGQYNLVSRNKEWTFVWNVSEAKVEAMYFNEVIEAAENIIYPEEVLKSGYYLIGKGNTVIEQVVNGIRNFKNDDNFSDILDLLDGTEFASFKSELQTKFNPNTTLFINQNGVFTTNNNTIPTVSSVLFSDDIAYIPSFNLTVNLPLTIQVPATIEYISEGAFQNVKSETKIEYAGKPIFEDGFRYNEDMLKANLTQPITSVVDYEAKGIALIPVKIGDNTYENESFVELDNNSISLAIKTFKETNNISIESNDEFTRQFRFGYNENVKFKDGLAYTCKFVVKLFKNGKLVGYSCIYYREADVRTTV